jgi:hypothetical protein
MMTYKDLDEVHGRMAALGIFCSLCYDGGSTKGSTVALQDGRFLVIGAPAGEEWHDSVDSVVEYVRASHAD